MKEIDELYHHCNKYIRCSVNACPLDSHYPRYVDPYDKQKVCSLSIEEIEAIKNCR